MGKNNKKSDAKHEVKLLEGTAPSCATPSSLIRATAIKITTAP